ncbi:MAG: ribonuclease R [Anaerofustis sp.]
MKNQILAIMNRNDYRPIKFKDFAYLLGLKSQKEREMLRAELNRLIDEKKIRLNTSQRYEWYRASMEKEGIYRASKGSFGFVEIDDDLFIQDIFIPGSESKGANNNDSVIVRIVKDGTAEKNPEGTIVRILKRAPQIYVGTFHKNKNYGFVVPDAKDEYDDVYIPKNQLGAAHHLDKVQIEIVKFPQLKHQKPEGRILHVLGNAKSEGMDMLSLIYRYQLPYEFSASCLEEAENLATDTEVEFNATRIDLTAEIIVTIDGESAKDLDDAVCVKRTPQGYRLMVSIADVSHYVKEHGAIDMDAYERGTSVYFPDRVVPMLPKKLSENLCSLNPKEKKFAFTADLLIDEDGKIIGSEFYKSIICSKARLTYSEVNRLLDGDTENLGYEYIGYRNELFLMKELADKLYKRRMQQGAIDLDIAEPYLQLNKEGNVIGLAAGIRGNAERIIEDFMLAANRSVAEFIYHTSIPSIYRVHEEPDSEKLREFVRFVSLLGYRFKLGKTHYSASLNQFVEEIKGTDQEYLLKKILLRCMKKAEYRSDSTSHFALAFMYYTHFTSPIRRYPDLMVHRILSKIIDGTLTEEYISYLNAKLSDIAYDCSQKERRAEEAEREAEKIKIAQYMQKHRGDIFDGVISSVLNFGMFVQLSNMAEGLVRFSDLAEDYYEVDSTKLKAVGKRTGKVRAVGDAVRVEILRVNIQNGEIDLMLLNQTNEGDIIEN